MTERTNMTVVCTRRCPQYTLTLVLFFNQQSKVRRYDSLVDPS